MTSQNINIAALWEKNLPKMPPRPTNIDITTLETRITLEPDLECNSLEKVTVEITTPDDWFIGKVSAYLIHRRSMRRGSFYKVMEPMTEGMWEFARLFSRYGLLNEEHVEHEFHKGTGCWEDLEAMSDSKWLFIEVIDITEASVSVCGGRGVLVRMLPP